MEMMGNRDPFTGNRLSVNSTTNDIIFTYLHFYHKLGDVPLKPNELPSLQAIDRVIRDLPGREKNLPEEERYRRFYSQS